MPTLTNLKIPNRVPRKKKYAFLQSLFFMVIILIAIFFLLQSSFFNISKITVVGNRQLEAKDVITLSALYNGTNIFKANLQTAEKNIKLNPLVKSVHLKRIYPSQVQITVTERTPVGLIPDRNRFIEVDCDGTYLNALDNIGQANYPMITGDKISKNQPGAKVTTEKQDAAISYLVNIPDDVKNTISEIHVKNLNQIVIYTLYGFEVRLGGTDKVADKAKLYQALIKQLNSDEKIEYIDIADVDHPAKKLVMPAGSDSSSEDNSPANAYNPPPPGTYEGRGSIPD